MSKATPRPDQRSETDENEPKSIDDDRARDPRARSLVVAGALLPLIGTSWHSSARKPLRRHPARRPRRM